MLGAVGLEELVEVGHVLGHAKAFRDVRGKPAVTGPASRALNQLPRQ
ncbi:MAG: hypothetical protein QOD07_1048, partial [Frankiaceae bacterium]|nr:hypothetical protein [Frankiaceae bacterium]